MNPIVFALRRPYSVLVGVVALLIGSGLASYRQKVDIFPPLNQPVIYVCQPYGGMNPAQMEGLLTSYYEYHFLYVNGVEHIESKNIQGMALIKLHFHPGTNMAEALAETVAAVNRSRFMMPPGTVPPFISRLDTGSASVGYLVLNSDKLSIKEIQDIASTRVRPAFANVPGISTPPAFGGNQRAIVVSVDPDALRSRNLTLDQITEALSAGNVVAPSGNVRIDDRTLLVNTNAMVGQKPIEELGQIPVKMGAAPVLLKDVATIADGADITAGYALVNGRRSVYMLVMKRSDASTVRVVNELNKALPKMRDAAPEVDIQFAFDQSPIVTEAMWGVGTEGVIGALFTGLMVLLFLRDWRSVIVVVLNIPLALLASVVALWLCGQSINLMTLGGLALAVGILVDESTVEVENIHSQMHRTDNLARAVRQGNQETAVPRLLAMLCVLAVFVPSFFMTGAARELFVPLSLAVGFAMIASYILSSTFVPVLCVWILKLPSQHATAPVPNLVHRLYDRAVARIIALRWFAVPVYLLLAGLGIAILSQSLGTAVFPKTDQGQFLLRMRAPTGTRIERTEELAQEALRIIDREAGAGNVSMTVGYVGSFPTNYPIQAVHQWSSGPEEAQLKIALKPGSGLRVEDFKTRLRDILDRELKAYLKAGWTRDGVSPEEREKRAAGLRLSFEPGDLVSDVMSFGSATPIEVQIGGNNVEATLANSRIVLARLKAIPQLRDLQVVQAQDYPTADIQFDRARAATMGLTARNISQSLVPATASSRYVTPIYWREQKTGQGYIVQVQVPPPRMNSLTELGQVPIRGSAGTMSGDHTGAPANGQGTGGESMVAGGILLRDVAEIKLTATPAEVDRYNMRRFVSITANVAGDDLGAVGRAVKRELAAAKIDIIDQHFDAELNKNPADAEKIERTRVEDKKTGKLPGGAAIDVRGQLNALDQVQESLTVGLGIAVLTIFLMLTGYFQSIKLALISIASIPATLCGVGIALLLTGTTLNLQSFMGAILSLGVSVANAILLVTFAERARLSHGSAPRAALDGGSARLRAILMTSCAMVAGMLPMAFGFGSGGDQTAPLGRAVVGGLLASTLATLFVLPAIFALIQRRAGVAGPSLDPDDPHSARYDIDMVKLFPEQ